MAAAIAWYRFRDCGGIMSRRDPIERYVTELRLELGRRGLRRRLLDEVEAHLRESVAVRMGGGAGPHEAASEAVRSFGAPREVAAALAREAPETPGPTRLFVTAASATAAVFVMFAALSSGPGGRVERESSAPPSLDGETVRVAETLDLSPDASAVLAKAQMLGRRAADCLLEHGARATGSGGLSDPSGRAHSVCQPLLDANERYLSHPEYLAMLSEAQPRFTAAERCQATRRPAEDHPAVSWGRPGGERGKTGCFRPDGLPAAATT